MRCLLLTDGESDFSAVLESCGIPITRMSLEDAAKEELSIYDTYAVLAYGKVLDPRLRVRLEAESAKGKRLFTEGLNSWGDIYSEEFLIRHVVAWWS
ncbi:MAG: hypothetical protein IJF20_03085 [Clostridia bacterium]|nr:hypothetical protein [Clostridia bacterium]